MSPENHSLEGICFGALTLQPSGFICKFLLHYLFFFDFLFWGLAVIADSPLFSTLVAQSAPEESRGTSLTIVNCIGFSITIVSIQFVKALSENISAKYIYMLLAIGPVLGLIALLRNKKIPGV